MEVQNTIIKNISVGKKPYDITINPNTSIIYVSNSKSNTISVIDGKTNSVTATVPVGNSPFALDCKSKY